MKITFSDSRNVKFKDIGIGDVFESENVVYIKINDDCSFDILNEVVVNCKGWDYLTPKESELIIY